MKLLARLTDVLGGPQRRRVIILLGGVLALSFADTATVGAVATQLERDLGISHTQLGLLPAASALIGALATLPAGVLVDRVPRVRLLAISVVLWSLASVASALSVSYTMLLVTRIGLGFVVAVATPAIASLTGDLFPPEERARVYGFILSGELCGAGVGFAAGGTLAGGLSWRAAFAWLAVPGLALAWALVRKLPEPARGGADRLAASGAPDGGEQREDALHAQLHARHVEPDPSRVLREDPDGMSLARVVRWVLLIPTNRLLIVSSALGYFFFSGVQTFAVVVLRHRFGLGQAPSSLLLVPALLFGALALALPLLILAVAAPGAANPALDAARLDVVPGRLWGRAEGVRTLLRQLATAAAPIAFGLTADAFGTGGTGALTGASETRGDVHDTFLVMLVALVASGLILLWGRGGFARDVATAEAAEYARWRSSR